jgi:hypothetical protein
MVKSIPIRVVSVAHAGYLRAGVRLGAGVNEISVLPDQLAAMEADPRLVVTVLAAAAEQLADDDAPPKGGVDSGLDGTGVIEPVPPAPIPSHYAALRPPVQELVAPTVRKGGKTKTGG